MTSDEVDGPSTPKESDRRENRIVPLPTASRYEVLLRLASGGMATVYVGRQRSEHGFSRLVAIKRAHPHLTEDDAFRAAFIREADITGRIRHPNVVAVHALEELGGEMVLVMDYVEGGSLSQLMETQSDSPLPARVVTRIILDVAAGLQAAHSLEDDDGHPTRVVHRDVSPQNILVGLDGSARIGDFGIARVLESTSGGTASKTIKGKLAYMAPEYVERAIAEPKGDVFCLAVVAWEAYSGKRLFRRASEPDTIRAVLEGPIPRLSTVAPSIGPELDDVLARALERDPAKRYGSAHEFQEALERAARHADLVASAREVSALVDARLGAKLRERRRLVRTSAKDAPPAEAQVAPRAEETRPIASGSDEGRRVLPPRPRSVSRRRATVVAFFAVVVGASFAGARSFKTAAPAAPIETNRAERDVSSALTGTPVTASAAPSVEAPASAPAASATAIASAASPTQASVPVKSSTGARALGSSPTRRPAQGVPSTERVPVRDFPEPASSRSVPGLGVVPDNPWGH